MAILDDGVWTYLPRYADDALVQELKNDLVLLLGDRLGDRDFRLHDMKAARMDWSMERDIALERFFTLGSRVDEGSLLSRLRGHPLSVIPADEGDPPFWIRVEP